MIEIEFVTPSPSRRMPGRMRQNKIERTLHNHPTTMTAVAMPFSSFHIFVASLALSSAVMFLPLLPPARSMISCWAFDMISCRPSCGVYAHQTTAKNTSHAVERMWSAKKRWAK